MRLWSFSSVLIFMLFSLGSRAFLSKARCVRPTLSRPLASQPESYPSLLSSSICGGAFTVVTPGTGLTIPLIDILPEEIEFVKSAEHLKSRQDIFMCGRVALRRSIRALGLPNDITSRCLSGPIMRNTLGAPILPAGVTGSISHKNQYAVGIVRPNVHESLGHWSDSLSDTKKEKYLDYGHVGIDVEKCNSRAFQALSERLLTENEINHMDSGRSSFLSKEEDVMLRFSFKESIFKALNPVLKRYVDFGEMEVYPQENGKALLNFCLRTGELFEYEAEYIKWSPHPGCDHWITCVYMYHMHKLKCS